MSTCDLQKYILLYAIAVHYVAM